MGKKRAILTEDYYKKRQKTHTLLIVLYLLELFLGVILDLQSTGNS